MSQKALILEKFGTPLVLQTRPIPEPTQDQILLKIVAVGRM
jgi:NADPH:quinone reductase-like Zn-dependent oxidoreductase